VSRSLSTPIDGTAQLVPVADRSTVLAQPVSDDEVEAHLIEDAGALDKACRKPSPLTKPQSAICLLSVRAATTVELEDRALALGCPLRCSSRERSGQALALGRRVNHKAAQVAAMPLEPVSVPGHRDVADDLVTSHGD